MKQVITPKNGKKETNLLNYIEIGEHNCTVVLKAFLRPWTFKGIYENEHKLSMDSIRIKGLKVLIFYTICNDTILAVTTQKLKRERRRE